MSLTKNGEHWYSDNQSHIREVIVEYSISSYIATHFADAVCICGNNTFGLYIDNNEGVAIRVCNKCFEDHPIADSGEYMDDSEEEECACPCSGESFEITVGVALYVDSEDVRWIYIGCRCADCGLTAVYGDWKNEFEDYKKLLSQV